MKYVKPTKLKIITLVLFGTGAFGIVVGLGIPGNQPILMMSLMGIITICLGGFFGFIFLTQKPRSGKKRKKSSMPRDSYKKPRAASTQDDTQFWVCPNCGNNTQMKGERQYCPSCKIYLSI